MRSRTWRGAPAGLQTRAHVRGNSKLNISKSEVTSLLRPRTPASPAAPRKLKDQFLGLKSLRRRRSSAAIIMREIVTLQFGERSNYLGTHFWNTQVWNFLAFKMISQSSQETLCINLHFRHGSHQYYIASFHFLIAFWVVTTLYHICIHGICSRIWFPPNH